MLDSKELNEVRRTAHYTDFSRRVKDFRWFPVLAGRRGPAGGVCPRGPAPPLRVYLLLQLDATRGDA
jgi:hypothetical protein